MSSLKKINEYYDLIKEHLITYNEKIKLVIDITFEIINAVFNLDVMTFDNTIVMEYINCRNRYDSLFSKKNENDDILELAVYQNSIILLHDNLMYLSSLMLIELYLNNNNNCQLIIQVLGSLLFKSSALFTDEVKSYNLLINHLKAGRLLTVDYEFYEKSIIIKSLNIVGSQYY